MRKKEQHLDLYGVENIKILQGNDYARRVIVESDSITGATERDPDKLEKSVRDRLQSVTESILCSCEIDFGEHSANPEYDILIPLNPENILNIEVKDYSGREAEPDEDDIINDPLNQAQLLDINHVFSIAKGIDTDLRQNFERSVELRDDIEIVHEEDIATKVRNYIQNEVLQNLVWSKN
jgi:hypothetical protein